MRVFLLLSILAASTGLPATMTQWVIKNRPTGDMTSTDFGMETVPSPGPPGPNEVIFRIEVLSVDASNRIWIDGGGEAQGWTAFKDLQKKEKDVMMSYTAVLKVVETNHPEWKVGDLALSATLVMEYVRADPAAMLLGPAQRVTKLDGVPLSYYLGPLGMATGLTAYTSIHNIAPPVADANQVVYISAAAGAVGLMAGQIYKHGGTSKVIGSASSDEKVKLLKEFGFDAAFNYKTRAVDDALAEYAPAGLDVYYDNVGGPILEAAITHMKQQGTIVACGAISQYNKQKDQKYGVKNLEQMVGKQLRMQGFMATQYVDQFPAATEKLASWLLAGSIKFEETTFPWARFGEALPALLTGGNKGKTLVAGPVAAAGEHAEL